jgi:hypothetical protein
MGCSIGTVKSYGARALGTLRSALALTDGASTGGAGADGAGADGTTSRKDR